MFYNAETEAQTGSEARLGSPVLTGPKHPKVVQTVAAGWRKKANAVLGSLKTFRKEVAFHSISGTSARRPL